MFDSLREDAAALLEGFDTHQLAAIAQFLTRATDFAYRRAALLRAQLLSAGGHPRAASNPDLHQQRGVAMNDDEQLTALFERMCRAWTEGDAQAYGSCFTPDCDYVSFDGIRARGRALMVESHDKLFRGVLFGTALVGEVESIRHLSHDVALVHGTGSVSHGARGSRSGGSPGTPSSPCGHRTAGDSPPRTTGGCDR